MAFEKVDKEFCLTDNTVNVYGYRCLTEGLLLDKFKPAIGYKMHNRDLGVAVKWEDFRIEKDKVFAKPVVNTTLFPTLVDEIKDGFMNAASCGKIVAVEISDDKKDAVKGQYGPTLKKWFPREISIVDIPGNYSAHAKLYDESDNVIRDLSDAKPNNPTNNTKRDMKQITMTAAMIAALSLSDNSTDNEFESAIQNVVAKATKFDAVKKELDDLKASSSKNEVEAILKKGIEDKKLTKDLSDKLMVSFAENPKGLQDLVNSMPAQVRVTETNGNVDVPEKYQGKSFQDLYVSGELEAVKRDYPTYYESLTKQK
ncbi:MAG: hypothetical protein PHW82_00420 [Bacteroidales bacterium]|nr:hypothetical protein [Bacteroidales bacterium]